MFENMLVSGAWLAIGICIGAVMVYLIIMNEF